MKTWQHIALGILIGLILAGGILLFILPNRGSPITLVTKTPDLTPQASATLALIRVHVTGAVNEPGLITLPKDACLADAIEKAGGLIEGYDQNLLNLSEPISDGQRIHIPRLDEQSISNFNQGRSITFSTEESLININTADFETLCLLPGIGPTKAQAIIQYREENGLFLDIADIQKVKGIGPTLFNTIKDQITIGD
ncbi:MAG TPA: ComEA family DNA-binding protein [Anaerolineaceae bacterium]|nr:ComEA family DNA-binding protein [Anaerolineaceae bacterium]